MTPRNSTAGMSRSGRRSVITSLSTFWSRNMWSLVAGVFSALLDFVTYWFVRIIKGDD
jgi:hypothetical protein